MSSNHPIWKQNLILASSSPRRKELLNQIGVPFKVIHPSVEEEAFPFKNPTQYATDISRAKAMSIPGYDKEIIMGVDTIVIIKGKPYGKPKNKLEAEKYITLLNGSKHKVISGITMVKKCTDETISKTTTTIVEFKKLTKREIELYVQNEKNWSGYAGAYAIQELAAIFVKKIQGSYSNVVGLPLETFYLLWQKITGSE